MSWFYRPKYYNLTAHGFLIKTNHKREARVLQTYLVDFADTGMMTADIVKLFDEAKFLDDFKALIIENPEWMKKEAIGDLGRSMLMIFVTTEHCTSDKFEFFIKEKKEEIHKVTSQSDSISLMSWLKKL